MVNGQWWTCVTSRQGSMSSLRSVCQAVGLHPLVGFGFCAVDVMLFGEEAATAGIGWAASIPVAFVLGIAAVFIQRYSFHDEWCAVFGKALLVALLTAIPTALPGSIFSLTGGNIGATKILLPVSE